MAPCGAGDPFDCGRRARKSRWKAAPAQNRRGSSCWSRKSRCCGLGTLRDCSLAAASVACSALTLTNAALAKPTATVALANPAIVIAATVVSQSAAAVALAATAVALAATTIAIAIAAAEVAIGLAILLSMYSTQQTISLDAASKLRN